MNVISYMPNPGLVLHLHSATSPRIERTQKLKKEGVGFVHTAPKMAEDRLASAKSPLLQRENMKACVDSYGMMI